MNENETASGVNANGVNIPEEQPEFDWTNVSWGMVKRSMKTQAALEVAIEQRDAKGIDLAMAEFSEFLAMVTVSIPQSWLVSSAPSDLDWDDAESFDWLKGNLFPAFTAAVGRSREVAEKN